MSTVKIAEYRNQTDHLYRLANVDYHACVAVREIEQWKEITARVLAETKDLQCSRANSYDRDQFAKATTAAKAQLIAADVRIQTKQQNR